MDFHLLEINSSFSIIMNEEKTLSMTLKNIPHEISYHCWEFVRKKTYLKGDIISLHFAWVTILCRTRSTPFVGDGAVHREKTLVDCVSMDASPQ